MSTYYQLNLEGKIQNVMWFDDAIPIRDENGNIIGYEDNVNDWVKENCILATKAIVQTFDGSYQFEDDVDWQEEAKLKAKKDFNEAKKAKIAELKSMRDTLEVEPIAYNGNLFDYDEKARDRINAAIISLDLLGAEAKLSWTTADNNEAIVSANDLRGVIASVAVRSNELHVHYRTKRELVDKATTVEEVEAIVW